MSLQQLKISCFQSRQSIFLLANKEQTAQSKWIMQKKKKGKKPNKNIFGIRGKTFSQLHARTQCDLTAAQGIAITHSY